MATLNSTSIFGECDFLNKYNNFYRYGQVLSQLLQLKRKRQQFFFKLFNQISIKIVENQEIQKIIKILHCSFCCTASHHKPNVLKY
jgi:hypothetical protein